MLEILSQPPKQFHNHPSEISCTKPTTRRQRYKEVLMKKQRERSNDSCAASKKDIYSISFSTARAREKRNVKIETDKSAFYTHFFITTKFPFTSISPM